MRLLFKYKSESSHTVSTDNNSIFPVEIKVMKPSLFKLNAPSEKISLKARLVRLLFYITTSGNFYIYYALTDTGEVAHTSCVLGKCYKYPFMTKKDYVIGPCVTNKKFRGKGIYPRVIQAVISDKSKNDTDFYMICEENNFPSIKGIEKAGFLKTAVMEKNFFKVYKFVNTIKQGENI